MIQVINTLKTRLSKHAQVIDVGSKPVFDKEKSKVIYLTGLKGGVKSAHFNLDSIKLYCLTKSEKDSENESFFNLIINELIKTAPRLVQMDELKFDFSVDILKEIGMDVVLSDSPFRGFKLTVKLSHKPIKI